MNNDDDGNDGNMMKVMRNDDHERVRGRSPGGGRRGSGAGLLGAADLTRVTNATRCAFARRFFAHYCFEGNVHAFLYRARAQHVYLALLLLRQHLCRPS